MLDDAKKAAELAGQVVDAAKNTEGGKLAAEELGRTALTLTRLVNNALLPIAAVNFAFDKAKEYFTTRFGEDMQERVKNIPADQLTPPKPSIAGQALQGLAYSHDEDELKQLYLGLLAKAMDKRTNAGAHPAFVEIIRQLSAAEIDLLRKVLTANGDLPVVEVRLVFPKGDYRTLRRHVVNLMKAGSGTPVEVPNGEVFIENWSRLGLVEVHYDKMLTGDDLYAPFASRPEVRAFQELAKADSRIECANGILHRTKFGLDFALAVGMHDA